MNGNNGGMVIDDSGTIYHDDPDELEWQKKMREAAKKSDRIYEEDGVNDEDDTD